MSCKKQIKGTKMSLAQFAALDAPKTKIPMKKFPVMEQLDERAPVVSMIEIMKEEKKNSQILTESDNSSDSDSQKPQVAVSKKQGRPNFKKGTRVELDHSFHKHVQAPTEYEQQEIYSLEYMQALEKIQREKLEKTARERAMKAKLDAIDESEWQKAMEEENFKSGELGQFSLDFYKKMLAARQRSIDETKFTSFGEMTMMLYQIPNMIRNLMMADILGYGIKVVSTISNRELKLEMREKASWDMILNDRNAYFKMTKNGKEIECDVRPTFCGGVNQEVQIVESSRPDKYNGPIHIVDMSRAAEYIKKMLI